MKTRTANFWKMVRRHLLTAVLVLYAGGAAGEADKPIIAHILADQDAYNGKSVTIYGLVVEVLDGGRAFMLQDVSQMPLEIVTPKGEVVFLGDQVLVKGFFDAGENEPRLRATDMEEAVVLRGGGCC